MLIKVRRRLIERNQPKPKFVNPYGDNPHLKPYDRKDSPYNTFGKLSGSKSIPQAPEPTEKKVGFFSEFLGFVFADIAYVADSVSGRTKKMKELRAERAKKKKENEEKYQAFVELAVR